MKITDAQLEAAFVVNQLKTLACSEGVPLAQGVEERVETFIAGLPSGERLVCNRYLDRPDGKNYIPSHDIAHLFKRRR